MALDIQNIRKDFPILDQQVHGKPLVYFDNGATTQKPNVVIKSIQEFYTQYNSNIHRGVHRLSNLATDAYEKARKTVQEFIGAKYAKEIIFTSGTTASINTIASSFGEAFLKEGDEIIVSNMEHHANFVPWQMMCKKAGAKLQVIPVTEEGELDMPAFEKLISLKTKLVAIAHVSNTLGTVNPLKEIISMSHAQGIPVLVDGAQAIQHQKVDVVDLDADFYVFSGHKIYAPTGIGVLYGKQEWLDKLPPYMGGGDMVDRVSIEETTFNELPFKFEAGTTNYVGAHALATAIDYVKSIGLENIQAYEHQLEVYGTEKLSSIPGLKIYGQSQNKIATFSFLLDSIHAFDTGMILDKLGIAVRTGTHCTQPIMKRYNIDGTVRASLCFYNTKEEIDQLVAGIDRVQQMFS